MKRPNLNYVQDMPPSKGYPEVPFTTKNGRRGPSGALIWGTIIGMTVYGLYKIGIRNQANRLAHKEQRECRMAIAPFLTAESVKLSEIERRAALEHEAKIMKHVPGWVVGQSVYSK